MRSPHAIMHLNGPPQQTAGKMSKPPIKPKKSGVKAIDEYYDNLKDADCVNSMRNATEFNRIVAQIKQHWKANKFPKCE